MHISSEVHIPPSATIAMNGLAAQKKKQGEVVYNLTVGEVMMKTDERIQRAAIDAMQAGKTLYTPAAGIPELRDAAVDWMNTDFGANFERHNVAVTCGGKHGLLMSLQSLLERGDEVIIIAPYWVSYPSMVRLCGGKSKILTTGIEQNWKVTPEQIQTACSQKTKVLILNNGSNPTGVLYTKEELQAILEVVAAYDLVVISDEVYSGLVYDDEKYPSAASFLEYRDRVVVIQSVSKYFAMTGWRVGFVFGPKELIASVETLQSQSTTGTASVSQWAALCALSHRQEIGKAILEEMQSRRDAFFENLKKYFGVSLSPTQAGLYAFLPMNSFGVDETDSLKWCMKMLEQTNVVFVPGVSFGMEGYVRASFGGLIAETKAALEQLHGHLKKN